jgi:hypothetical protein
MSTHRLVRLAGLAAAGALLYPAAASAHPGWYFVTAKVAKTAEVQTLSTPGATWKPSPGATTIADTATAAQVQAALDADPAIVPGSPGYDNVRVAGNAGGPYTVTFVGTLAGANVPQLVPAGAIAGTTRDGGANVGYTGDPTADQAAMADQDQAVIVNDGYTFGYRETNGLGPVPNGPAYSGGGGARAFTGAGMLNLSKILPGGYRTGMSELQKLEYPQAQTGIQVHATCAGVAALQDPANIAAVWYRASDQDPFYNYIPWQNTSAGLGDDPGQWIPVVKSATGVDLSTLSSVDDFKSACTGLGGTYHPADTQSTTASAAISDAVNGATAPLTTQITSLTAQVGSLVPRLDQLETANAALVADQAAARPLKLTLTGGKLSSGGVTTMVTGAAGASATVTITVTSAVKKALRLSSATIATKRKALDTQGAALVSLAARKAVTKALEKAKGSVTATVTATAGTAKTSATAKLTD